MLAIQRPRMGSTQPSDPNLPFGYAVDPIPQELFLDAPDPAPGAPLLSDSENREISNFFENLTSEHYYTCFGEGLNFSDVWLDDLPPTFMGSTTSFGQSPAPLHSPGHGISHVDFSDMMSLGSNLMPPPPPPPQQQQQQPAPPPPRQHQQQQQLSEQQQASHHILEQHHSADVLAAATLLQNGSSSRSNNSGSSSMFNNRDVTHSLGPPVGHLRHQPMEDFKRAEGGLVTHSSLNDGHEATLADMFFSPAPGERGPVQRPTQVPDVPLQWGSDGRFNGSESYMPADPKDSYENMSDDRLRYMQCLQRNESVNNTRAPSPNNEHILSKGHSRKSSEVVKKEEDADAPPRKRRKSRNTKDDVEEEDEESGPATKAARKRKSKSEQVSTTPPTENGAAGRRRKSGAGAKPPRENLSEAQKRENHIRSEQKRRTLIKEGFDDLCDLVPGLKGGGFSKSTMLTMAAEWLEEIMKHNEELRAQVSAVEGR
ncbi:BHLH family transcription factor [Colletotrichum plurivorum]|uniref:BHLH family transcription factor n=1 Tax=Colletotrichum plurivorum TaxID=2175906 RepID=A0A8H6KP48_9PEZI|nr:BHLH family transcription factor [Colletotrichum plurivorum]